MTVGSSQLDTWPFWAPSEAASVEAALDLAGVARGDRVLDLGCGDGHVLLAAARRGAVVAGIEADPDLVAEARHHLAEAGVDADIREGDLFDPDLDLDADVLFAYLAPATLQRLLPTLRPRRGVRLVTVDFAVPGMVPTKRAGSAHLYVLPGRRRPVGPVGWSCAGTLVATVPDCQSLTCLDAVHPGGPVSAHLSTPLAGVATLLAGASGLEEQAHLALDVRWEPMAPGSIVGGSVRVSGLADHWLVVIATEDDEGMWELTAGAVQRLGDALRARIRPRTIAELLDATSS